MRSNNLESFFSNQQLEREFRRTVSRRKRRAAFIRSISMLIVILAVWVLVSNLWFPIYHITGNSMHPTLEQGMIVISSRIKDFSAGDIVSFQFGNRVLISRLIGMPGDSVQIDAQGIVSVNGIVLNECYLVERVLGTTDLTYPYQVPDRHFFIMGDNRAESKDSRMSAIGCIEENVLDGEIVFCIWPLHRFGSIG